MIFIVLSIVSVIIFYMNSDNQEKKFIRQEVFSNIIVFNLFSFGTYFFILLLMKTNSALVATISFVMILNLSYCIISQVRDFFSFTKTRSNIFCIEKTKFTD